MTIIITDSFVNNQFLKYKVSKPNHLLEVDGKTLFERALLSFSNFYSERFIFILHDVKEITKIKKIIEGCSNFEGKKISNYELIIIENFSLGSAEIILNAIKLFNVDDSVLIYEIANLIKTPNLCINKNDFTSSIDGMIFTTKSNFKNSFYAHTLNDSNQVVEINKDGDKNSNVSIGLYYLKSFQEFVEIIYECSNEVVKQHFELSIMPMFQYLIDKGKKVVIKDIPNNKVIFLVP